MKVTQVRINGMINPIGYSFEQIQVSWKVEEAKAKNQKEVVISVSDKADMSNVVYSKSGDSLQMIGETLSFDATPKMRYFVTVQVITEDETAISDVSYFETAKMQEPWRAQWITTSDEDQMHPRFFKNFQVEKEIKDARLYVSGVGLFEAYINGNKVGDEYLAPLTSDYHEYIQYNTYEVGGLVQGENELSIICGNGWYKGRIGYEGHEAVYGDAFAAIAELDVYYADGSMETIATDSTWKYEPSRIVMSDIYDGETIDCNVVKGESKPVSLASNLSTNLLRERNSLPLRTHETFTAKEILTTPAGECVLDFGQNFAGIIRFDTKKLKQGDEVIFEFGEVLQNGNFYYDNYRTAKSIFTYKSDGRDEVARPHFTFFGFRYVKVSGWPGEIENNDIIATALYSDISVTGSFASENAKINQLFSNALWGQKSNFLDMPMDCPQRDERLGWTGDAQVFAPTASFNMFTKMFYQKYLDDLHIEQAKWNGAVPNYIPNITNTPGGAAIWGDAATFIPMTLYEYYGDKEQLRHNFPMMKQWVDYLTEESRKHESHYLIDFGMQFGDWLAMDGMTEQSFKGGTDEYYLASIYYYASSEKVSQAAAVLGYKELEKEYATLADRIKNAILDEYFSNTGRLAIDTQAAYIVSLRFGVYQDKRRIVDGFKERLRKDCYRIRCGFVGAPVMCQVLAENEMTELAYPLLFFEGFPGWLRQVNLGATTIWERWNSLLDDGSISGTGMNSLNHYAYGSVVEFYYRYIAGIQTLVPGFGKAKIAPKPNYRLKKVDCAYDSISGKYRVQYELKPNNKVWIRVEVPFGCEAELWLPGTDQVVNLQAGVYEREYTPDVNLLKGLNEHSTLEELKSIPAACALLQQKLPQAYGMMMSGDKEAGALSLHDMMNMPYMGFDPAVVANVIEEMKEIEVV